MFFENENKREKQLNKSELLDNRRRENLRMIDETYRELMKKAQKDPVTYCYQWSELFLVALETAVSTKSRHCIMGG